MIDPKIKETLDQLATSHFGTALGVYLTEAKKELNDVTMCESWDDTLGRKKAVQILDKIFGFLKEKEIPQTKKNNYV